MSSRGPKHMSGVDAAWLRMDSPDNLMMITALLFMGESVDRDEVRRVVATRLLRWDRFRQRVVNRDASFTTPQWVWADDFSLDDHLVFRHIGENASREVLEQHVAELMSTSLDYSKPLWQFHLLEGYEEGPVLLCRLHHCLADGMALLRVLLSLTDEERSTSRYIPLADKDFYAAGKPGSKRSNDETPGVMQVARKLASNSVNGVASLGKLLFRPSDPRTALRGPLQVRKLASWSPPISLEDVRRVSRKTGCTINDVLVTALTGGLRKYIKDHGDQLESSLNIRAAIPVNLRARDADITMGNQFGLVFLSLPVGWNSQRKRLHVLRSRMDRLKKSAEPLIIYGLLTVVGRTSTWFEHKLVRYLADKVTAVVTNVPGPRKQRYLAGAPLTAILPWVPQAGRVGLGVSIFSYAGEIRIGVATDAGVLDNPRSLADLIASEFYDLREKMLD